MVQNLSKGDEIVTQGGILGKVTDVSENILTCKIADNVEVKVQSHAVARFLPKGTYQESVDCHA